MRRRSTNSACPALPTPIPRSDPNAHDRRRERSPTMRRRHLVRQSRTMVGESATRHTSANPKSAYRNMAGLSASTLRLISSIPRCCASRTSVDSRSRPMPSPRLLSERCALDASPLRGQYRPEERLVVNESSLDCPHELIMPETRFGEGRQTSQRASERRHCAHPASLEQMAATPTYEREISCLVLPYHSI